MAANRTGNRSVHRAGRMRWARILGPRLPSCYRAFFAGPFGPFAGPFAAFAAFAPFAFPFFAATFAFAFPAVVAFLFFCVLLFIVCTPWRTGRH